MKPRARSTRLSAVLLVASAGMFVPISDAAARESLGVFAGWGAFRDETTPPRCFAIAEPVRRGGEHWRAALSIGFRPDARGQVHVRLSRRKLRGTRVILTVGERRFALIAGGSDAWAPNARIDGEIVATIRAGTSLTVEAQAANGRAFVDAYPLRGAATAIDAAALGCARGR